MRKRTSSLVSCAAYVGVAVALWTVAFVYSVAHASNLSSSLASMLAAATGSARGNGWSSASDRRWWGQLDVIDFDNRFATVGAWDAAGAPPFADLPAGPRIVSLAQTLGMGARVRQRSLGFPFRVWARREIECPPNTPARSEEGVLWAAAGSTVVLVVIAAVAAVAFRDAVVAALALARSRRGACRACGYDLAGVPARVCPECGAECRA